MKFYVSALVGIIKVTLRNARCNNKDTPQDLNELWYGNYKLKVIKKNFSNIHVFCIYLRTNSDLCHLQHELIGFYNRD